MDWSRNFRLLFEALTRRRTTVLDAVGRGDRWRLRLLSASSEELRAIESWYADRGLALSIEATREVDGRPGSWHGLTTRQYAALVLALERDYWQIPRETNLGAIADELDITHQTLSERLRRGMGTLLEESLRIGYRGRDEASPAAVEGLFP